MGPVEQLTSPYTAFLYIRLSSVYIHVSQVVSSPHISTEMLRSFLVSPSVLHALPI
jgi:hypothetical protein